MYQTLFINLFLFLTIKRRLSHSKLRADRLLLVSTYNSLALTPTLPQPFLITPLRRFEFRASPSLLYFPPGNLLYIKLELPLRERS